MTKILFFSEAMTLAHRMRPYVIAESLDRSRFEVGFASDKYYADLFQTNTAKTFKITSLSAKDFQDALWYSRALCTSEILDLQVKEDLTILREFKPDLVVGDFRLSLNISSKIAGVPMVNLTNFYWKNQPTSEWEVPDSSISHLLGVRFANFIFKHANSLLLASHTKGFKEVAKKWAVAGFEDMTLDDLYVNGDITLFCDIEKLVGMNVINHKRHILGPLLWSPDVAPPSWWNELPDENTAIYLNLGSSGKSTIVPTLLEWLKSMNLKHPIVIGGAGNGDFKQVANNSPIYFGQYLKGMDVCQRSRVVICNGGSPTTQQALSQGAPVFGITSNIDQMLNMKVTEKYGAGLSMRSDKLNQKKFCDMIERLLTEKNFQEKACDLKKDIEATDIQKNFSTAISSL